jgi:hypothetical protein
MPMTVNLYRRIAGLLVGMSPVVAVACSSAAPPPDAMVQMTLGSGSNFGECPFSQTASINIGTATAHPVTVADGATQGGGPNSPKGTAHVSCTVTASGGGFDVAASATLEEGMSGGNLTFQGHVNGSCPTSAPCPISVGSFTANSQTYTANNGCTIVYQMGGQDLVPTFTAAAAAGGRIWGHIDCPMATKGDQFVAGPDGGQVPATCEGAADFLFENCGQ